MIIIEEQQKEQYPHIWKQLQYYGGQKYLESLYQSISRQLETQRYYKMKFGNIILPNIKKEDILNEIEKFLPKLPNIFVNDYKNFCQ